MPKVTVYIAAQSTPTITKGEKPAQTENGEEQSIKAEVGKSLVGHMWYSLTDDDNNVSSFGFSPAEGGSASAPGKVNAHGSDLDVYQGYSYKSSLEITKEQYDAMLRFGEGPERYGFDLWYNGFSNSCVDFTWKALEVGGVNINKFEGHLWPTANIKTIKWLFSRIRAEQKREQNKQRAEDVFPASELVRPSSGQHLSNAGFVGRTIMQPTSGELMATRVPALEGNIDLRLGEFVLPIVEANPTPCQSENLNNGEPSIRENAAHDVMKENEGIILIDSPLNARGNLKKVFISSGNMLGGSFDEAGLERIIGEGMRRTAAKGNLSSNMREHITEDYEGFDAEGLWLPGTESLKKKNKLSLPSVAALEKSKERLEVGDIPGGWKVIADETGDAYARAAAGVTSESLLGKVTKGYWERISPGSTKHWDAVAANQLRQYIQSLENGHFPDSEEIERMYVASLEAVGLSRDLSIDLGLNVVLSNTDRIFWGQGIGLEPERWVLSSNNKSSLDKSILTKALWGALMVGGWDHIGGGFEGMGFNSLLDNSYFYGALMAELLQNIPPMEFGGYEVNDLGLPGINLEIMMDEVHQPTIVSANEIAKSEIVFAKAQPGTPGHSIMQTPLGGFGASSVASRLDLQNVVTTKKVEEELEWMWSGSERAVDSVLRPTIVINVPGGNGVDRELVEIYAEAALNSWLAERVHSQQGDLRD